MKQLTVESAFRQKYNSLLGLSIGIPLLCVAFNFVPIPEGTPTLIANAVSCIGALICIIFGFKSILLQIRIYRHRSIDNALRTELLDYNDHKAYFMSYSILMMALLVIAVLSLHMDMSVTKVALGLWWAGVEIYCILWLVLNR